MEVLVSSNKVCWVAEASVYTFIFVMYAEIVHVQWYRGWSVETGLHKHDFWEIIKSKIRHSYEAHIYLRHIEFARWFQRIESLFGGNLANGPSIKDKCTCRFSHGR